MSPLARRVALAIETRGLLPRGGRVLVALSGGPDSVALLFLLRELAARGLLTVAGIVHVNHSLRGEASDADERFCRHLASRLSLPIDVIRADVAAKARACRVSIEAAARRVRHEAFESVARRFDTEAVAVGHTRDDQAETFLLKALRGAGPRGLGGVYPRRGVVVRPLLDVPRADLRRYLAERAEPFCEDATNLDLANPRNRIRHELLPLLETRFSPRMAGVLARNAAIARADAEWLDRQALEAERSVVDTATESSARLSADAIRSLPDALAWRVAHRVLTSVAQARFVGFDAAEALVTLARRPEGTWLHLPGASARVVAGWLELTRRSGRPSRRRAAAASEGSQLPLPGSVTVNDLGWVIRGEYGEPAGGLTLSGRGHQAMVAPESLLEPLIVRSRRPGDRLRPLGLGGRKKLQDLFVDRKVPAGERDSIPIVVDAAGRIVWVVGLGIGDEFRVTDRDASVIILTAKRLVGGPG